MFWKYLLSALYKIRYMLAFTLSRSASDMLGHDERMLVKHYLRAMTKEYAEVLLNTTPRSPWLVKAPDCGVPFQEEIPTG